MQNEIKAVGILGATGKAGRQLARKALDAGYLVKVLVRRPESIGFRHPNMELIQGDATETASIQRLVQACDALINAVGQNPKDKPFYSEITGKILETAKTSGLKRYIGITGAAVNAPSDRKSLIAKVTAGLMKLFYPAMMLDKQKELSLLLHSDLDWTLVRLPLISEKQGTGIIKVSLETTPGTKISNTDIADFIVAQVGSGQYSRQCPFISN